MADRDAQLVAGRRERQRVDELLKERDSHVLAKHATANKAQSGWRTREKNVPFVNRPFESEIHGTVNFTQFCFVLLVTWCYRVLLSCYLRPK